MALVAAADGYGVELSARTVGSLQTVTSEIERKTARKAHAFPVDLSRPGAARELFGDIVRAAIVIAFS